MYNRDMTKYLCGGFYCHFTCRRLLIVSVDFLDHATIFTVSTCIKYTKCDSF